MEWESNPTFYKATSIELSHWPRILAAKFKPSEVSIRTNNTNTTTPPALPTMPPPLQRGRNLVALRTLLVKVDPTPANLTERRAILSLLKRHGSIHTFKRLLVRLISFSFFCCRARDGC